MRFRACAWLRSWHPTPRLHQVFASILVRPILHRRQTLPLTLRLQRRWLQQYYSASLCFHGVIPSQGYLQILSYPKSCLSFLLHLHSRSNGLWSHSYTELRVQLNLCLPLSAQSGAYSHFLLCCYLGPKPILILNLRELADNYLLSRQRVYLSLNTTD